MEVIFSKIQPGTFEFTLHAADGINGFDASLLQGPGFAPVSRQEKGIFMIVPEHIGPDSLKAFAKQCEASLLSGAPYHFRYPKGASVANWPVEAIKGLNQDFLSNLRGKGNVYALWVRENETWAPAYVGQRKLKSLRERLTQHLIVKSEQTGSMLDAVKKAVGEGKEIGVSLIKVSPDSLRLYVEAKILDEKKPELLWNTHG